MIRFFDDSVASGDSHLHHPIARKFLDPAAPLREQLESFVDDNPMGSELSFESSKFRFIPVVERSIESKHSLITRRAQTNWRSGRFVSLTLRMSDIQD